MKGGAIAIATVLISALIIIPVAYYYPFVKNVNLTNPEMVEKMGLDALREQYKVPGVTYVVLKDGEIVEKGASGYIYNGSQKKVTVNSKFHIGSNTKAFTALIAAKLVEQGVLSWQTRFFDVLPELKAGARPEYWDMTLENLLSHRAHIPVFGTLNDISATRGFTGMPKEQRLQFAKYTLALKPVLPRPQEVYVYSNAGYGLAATMLEVVTGVAWEEMVQKTAQDLGISVGLSWPNQTDNLEPWGHFNQFGKRVKTAGNAKYKLNSFIAPAGDMHMSIMDYARYLQLFMQGLDGKDSYLQASTYRHLMLGLPAYSLGWAHGEQNGLHLIGHDGSAGNYYVHVGIVEEAKVALIVFTNAPACQDTMGFIGTLQNYMLQKYKVKL